LGCEVSGASVPELGQVKACVQRRGRVAAAALPERPRGGGFIVDATFCSFYDVARVTGL
jgi:hypothetical protein